VTALLGTPTAHFGAALAVFGFVFLALGGAGFTDVGANTAEFGGELRSAAHEGRRTPADFRAVSVEPDALGHFLDVWFAKAGAGAALTRLGTLHASLDAGCISVVGHRTSPFSSQSLFQVFP
jgi:hypothetical protein